MKILLEIFGEIKHIAELCSRKTPIGQRCGSSAWLEYMPVTHGVAGSSPVRTARALGEIRALFLFFSDGFKADCGVAVGGKGCEEIHNHL